MDTSMNSKCTRFIHYMVMDDFNRGRGSFDYSPAQHSPSKFVINMDYTQVPLEITIVPIGELRNIDQPMETAIETALKSNGKLMVAMVKVRGGAVISSSPFTVESEECEAPRQPTVAAKKNARALICL